MLDKRPNKMQMSLVNGIMMLLLCTNERCVKISHRREREFRFTISRVDFSSILFVVLIARVRCDYDSLEVNVMWRVAAWWQHCVVANKPETSLHWRSTTCSDIDHHRSLLHFFFFFFHWLFLKSGRRATVRETKIHVNHNDNHNVEMLLRVRKRP